MLAGDGNPPPQDRHETDRQIGMHAIIIIIVIIIIQFIYIRVSSKPNTTITTVSALQRIYQKHTITIFYKNKTSV